MEYEGDTESGLRARGALSLLDELPELAKSIVSYAEDEVILEEGENNDDLLILISGMARLSKRDFEGIDVVVDQFGPGSLLGLTSFWTRAPVYARVVACSETKCVSVTRDDFEKLNDANAEFARMMRGLFVRNLSDRYRNMIRSNVERVNLSHQLTRERNQLREALTHLEQTRNRLVNQEKLATMGQLLAGIAHEINNPVGALTRGVENTEAALKKAFSAESVEGRECIVLSEGLDCPFWGPAEKRKRMEDLMEAYPKIGRPTARRLAQLTDGARDIVIPLLSAECPDELERLLTLYELGVCFRAVRISSGRIEKIVTGLRNYGRQSSGSWGDADIVQGIRDTLTVLNNRLRHYDLRLDLDEVGMLHCDLGEINQVWTNLLVNAMDATAISGEISITAKLEDGRIVVRIEDSGTGIPPDKLTRIFEPNYTSKNQSGSYGLGLGLSISKEIIEKHGGSLTARNRSEGGACLEVILPSGR